PSSAEKEVPPENPRQQLPVSTRPAVIAKRGNVVPSRVSFNDFDVRGEPSTGKHALEEIVTQQRRVGCSASQGSLKGIHRINAFSRIGTLLEQILIDVGH